MAARAGILTTLVVLAGLTFAPPAPAFDLAGRDQPVAKWLKGETHPVGNFPTTPSLKVEPTSPSVATPSPAPTVAPTVSVSSRLGSQKRKYHVGEPVHLYIELSWIGAVDDVRPETPEEPLLRRLEKRPGGMVQSTRVQPDTTPPRVIVTYHYVFDPVEPGPASIEPITVYYRLKGGSEKLQLTTERYALTLLPRRLPWGKILGWVFGGLVGLAVIIAAVVAVRARARRARQAAQAPPPPSPYERMAGDIEQIRRLFTEGASRDAYDAVDRFIRAALAERLGDDLRVVTISELMQRVDGAGLNSSIRDRVESILDRCGAVKFAGYVPTVADQDQILADCRLLLDDLEKESKDVKPEDGVCEE